MNTRSEDTVDTVKDDNRPRSKGLLLAGIAVGALLAGSGLIEWRTVPGQDNLLASINATRITRAEYLAHLEMLSQDKRNPVTATDRRRILDRIIEEKLLIGRGLELGLAESESSVRKAIVSAMIETITAEAASTEPSPEQLQTFYDANINYFAAPNLAAVQRMVFKGEQASTRALKAYQALVSGASWSAVSNDADRDLLSLPAAPLPVARLRGYLGPTLTETALALQPGQFSEPLIIGTNSIILRLLELQRAQPQPLTAIREQVTREFQRRASDESLRSYLQRLRREADIRIDEAFLESLDALAVDQGIPTS